MTPATNAPLIHRDITISRADVPGAPYEWIHDEGSAHGQAETIEQACRQINLHLGSPDPDCPACRGTGREDWAYLGIVRCRLCWVADAT